MPELEQQVRLMGEVYSKAKHVLIYPGEVPWNIELAALFVRMFRTKNKDYNDTISIYVLMNAVLFCLVGRFPRWEYWTRMWIVQEIILAKTAFLVLRNGLLDLQHFVFAYPLLGADLGPSWETPAWKIIDLRYSWTELPPKPSLSELIQLTSGAGCQKQNDRIYALLGLLPKELSDKIVIDYNRDWSLVVLDALQIVRSGVLSLTTEADMLRVFEGIQSPLLVLCGECAKSPEHVVQLPDGRAVAPISELVDEDQDIFWISDPSSVVAECSRSELLRREIGWRPLEPVVCSCCAVELLSDYSLDLTLSRPVESMLCGKAREREHRQSPAGTDPAASSTSFSAHTA